MRTSLHDVWGCGRGPVRHAAPETRLAAGGVAFAGCMVSSGATISGSCCAVAIGAGWLVACRPPWSVVRATLVLGLVLLLPYFLLLPLLPDTSAITTESLWRSLVVPWTILVRGLSCMVVAVGTVTTLSAAELRDALLRLPVPKVVSAILLQIVHQTGVLLYETRRVAAAMAVRGASSGGTAAWRVLFSLPRAWLPRVIIRAERVGAAMDLRGYCDGPAPSFRRTARGWADFAVLGSAVAALALAISLRVLGVP